MVLPDAVMKLSMRECMRFVLRRRSLPSPPHLTNTFSRSQNKERGERTMKKCSFDALSAGVAVLLLLSLGIGVQEGSAQAPPISSPLVREGAFAMKLAEALNVGQPSSEAEAESMLGAVGIAPRNGWIADYPVTPDIVGELRDAVGYSAQASMISMDTDAALATLESVQASEGVIVTPGPAGPGGAAEGSEGAYPDQTAINNYYSAEGPPIVTYYSPPPDYFSLYAWVPYPFWWSGVWFGGFFVLHDFHKHYREGGHVYVVSNHFNDVNAHRVFRIDPVKRLNGRTFAGIGAPSSGRFVSSGVPKAPERVFNRNRSTPASSGTRTIRPQGSAAGSQPSAKSFKANPFPENRVYSQPPGAGRTYTPRSGGSGGNRTPAAPGSGGAGAR
jgi:hypothetical protein